PELLRKYKIADYARVEYMQSLRNQVSLKKPGFCPQIAISGDDQCPFLVLTIKAFCANIKYLIQGLQRREK
ncbi:MAG: hypothetical protein QME81_14045, partial [bacterium]|nr:hypothetical protein [bacterium]